jgi:hypothetical protein
MYGLSRVLRVPIPFLNGGTESDFCVLTADLEGRVAVSVLQRQPSPKLGVKGFIPSCHVLQQRCLAKCLILHCTLKV